MTGDKDFLRDYFLQTRKEIEHGKAERDRILHFAVIIIGAVGFAFAQSEHMQRFLLSTSGLFTEVAALVIVTSLFWIRRTKLRQIADRWFVLRRLLPRIVGEEEMPWMLENVVYRGLSRRRYARKDIVLNLAFCLPIYGLLVHQAIEGWESGATWRAAVALAGVLLHVLVSTLLLSPRLTDATDIADSDPAGSPQNRGTEVDRGGDDD